VVLSTLPEGEVWLPALTTSFTAVPLLADPVFLALILSFLMEGVVLTTDDLLTAVD
jgi:hypothetical protein